MFLRLLFLSLVFQVVYGVLVVVNNPEYQVLSDKIIYHFTYCSHLGEKSNVSIYSKQLIKNVSFELWPNSCRDLVLEFKKENLVFYTIEEKGKDITIKTEGKLFFKFDLEPEQIIKKAEIKGKCFNGSCVVNAFYEFNNPIDDVKVETPFHIYTTRKNLSFKEEFYIGQSKSFDYYNNIYYGEGVLKRKIKLFNYIPKEEEPKVEEPNKTIEMLPQDTQLDSKQKLILILFILLLILNFSFDFIKAKIKGVEDES